MTSAARPDLASLRQAITERERSAAAAVHRLREQIAVLTDHLARAETELADLATTRRTLTTLTGEPDPTTDEHAHTAGSTATVGPAGTAEPADVVEAVANVEAMAPSSPTYPQILAVFTGTDTMRAKDICLALGLDTIPKNTEGVRAKLKRLVTRGALREDGPGLFALAAEPEHSQPR
jgi:hypothetical protein